MKKSKQNKQFDRQFGLYVKKKRLEMGWSQPDLAEKLDVNFQNISRLERGEITPTIFWCYKLAAAFDIGLSELITDVGYKLKK